MADILTEFLTIAETRVARVTIDRPDKLNALNADMMDRVIKAFEALASDAELRAVILAGAGGKAWIGGADIGEMAALSSPRMAAVFIHRLHSVMLSVRNLPVPVVAAIGGYCLGGGMELAAACDLRIASTNARFGMPEVQVGLPSVIEASLLPGLMGRGRAGRLVLTGEVIDAARAFEWGFVEEVVAPNELDAAVERVVADICRAGPVAVQLQKQLLRYWEQVPPDTGAEESIETFGSAFETGEPAERLGRFANRRKPD
ncbi:MAG: enoyl-CoA hydratase [Rhodospirillaceae bacterium]